MAERRFELLIALSTDFKPVALDHSAIQPNTHAQIRTGIALKHGSKPFG